MGLGSSMIKGMEDMSSPMDHIGFESTWARAKIKTWEECSDILDVKE